MRNDALEETAKQGNRQRSAPFRLVVAGKKVLAVGGLGLVGWQRGGFYRKGHFMDCIGEAGVGYLREEECFFRVVCVWLVFSKFVDCKGRGRWDLWLLDFGSRWVCRGRGVSFGFIGFVFLFDGLPECEQGLAHRQQRSLGVSIKIHDAGCLWVQMRHAVN